MKHLIFLTTAIYTMVLLLNSKTIHQIINDLPIKDFDNYHLVYVASTGLTINLTVGLILLIIFLKSELCKPSQKSFFSY